jgi:molybdopterin-binding protein
MPYNGPALRLLSCFVLATTAFGPHLQDAPVAAGAGIVSTTERQMKLSARNILKGRILGVTRGATTSHVRIDIGGAVVTASITNEAVDELKLAEGKQAYAVVKASDVMVGID